MCTTVKCFCWPRVWRAVKKTPKHQGRKPWSVLGKPEDFVPIIGSFLVSVFANLSIWLFFLQIISLNHDRRWMLHTPVFAWTLNLSSVWSSLWQNTDWARLDLLNKILVGCQVWRAQNCLWSPSASWKNMSSTRFLVKSRAAEYKLSMFRFQF